MEHKIYLTDLNAYNNGALIGDWFDITEFNRDDDNFSQICERCGIKEGTSFLLLIMQVHLTSTNTLILKRFTDHNTKDEDCLTCDEMHKVKKALQAIEICHALKTNIRLAPLK